MSWTGKFIGGAFGFLLGGPLGAVLGASVGHQFDLGLNGIDEEFTFPPDDRHRVQTAFFTATFSVMGHIAKADGRVSPEEIAQANRIMEQLSISGDMRKTAIHLFRQGKNPGFPLDEVLAQFYRECHQRADLMRLFFEIQMQEAFADGVFDHNKERLLLHIGRNLRISRFEYERIKIQLQAQQRFQGWGQKHRHRPGPKRSSLEEAYGVLGLTPSASEAEIKKAYRRLMSKHHPDKLAARGLPEDMMKLAKEKTQKISKAYETIMKSISRQEEKQS
ncbi:co-chaperone DjlA [Methylosarcina fibrata]|uniref:co-chaperone DjlA n=1 Tax=Methylosarcina fibrata TaxID=105972 RepID=UPI0003702E10|nr:co-chaperone DjlA [Methylosarcina fibrata]